MAVSDAKDLAATLNNKKILNTKSYLGKTVLNHMDLSVKARDGIRIARCQRRGQEHRHGMYAGKQERGLREGSSVGPGPKAEPQRGVSADRRAVSGGKLSTGDQSV